MRPFAFLGALVLACTGCPSEGQTAVPAAATAQPASPKVYEKTVLSDPYHVDAKYASMRGPWSQLDVTLLDAPQAELVWITGYKTRVVDATTAEEVGQDFMCHANLDFDVPRYYDDFNVRHGLSGRVFTLSQGQQHVQFPTGMGIPFLSNEPLKLTTQVLNLNLPNPDLNLRHQVTVEFVRDAEVKTPMQPLFQGAVQGFKSLEGDGLVYGIESPDMDEHGAGCSVGSSAIENDVDHDQYGRKFTAHWVVEPGREVTRTLVTEFLNLQFDTRVHYIAVHLHPFAESLELIDRTTGTTLYKAEAVNAKGRIGLEHLPFLSSEEGLPVFKDHEYELVAIYDNTSNEPVDSMAVMYMYMADPHFKKPDLTKIAPRISPEEAPATDAPPSM